jgi:hypothetical protein
MGRKKKLKNPVRITLQLEKEDLLTLEKYRRLYDFMDLSKALRDILTKIRKNMGWEKEIKEWTKSEGR